MDYETQKAVIGSLLMDISQIEKVYTTLSPEKFSDADLGKIYYELKTAYDNGKSVDINILTFKLSEIPNVTQLLSDCLEHTVTSTNITEYANAINKSYKARCLGDLLNIQPNPENIMEQLEQIERQVQELQQDRKENVSTADELVDKYSVKKFREDREQGVQTGFSELDEIIMGLDGGDICIVGARPAVGKTAFSINMALNIAHAGLRVELFELEMKEEQIYDRMIAFESEIDLKRIKRALRFNTSEEEKFQNGNDKLKSLKNNLIVTDDINRVSEMGLSLKRHKADVGIVDYLQLITPESNYRGNRYAEVGAISHGLKKIAMKLDIPIIVLCQLNRVTDEFKEPSMSEIRESGDVEQDASQIILLWNKTEDKAVKGIKVAKNRNGETDKIEMRFNGKLMKFENEEWENYDDSPFK